jgi:hypothetical protein
MVEHHTSMRVVKIPLDLIENMIEGVNVHIKVSWGLSVFPTLVILSWISRLSFKIFLQDQEQALGGFRDQKFLFLIRYV